MFFSVLVIILGVVEIFWIVLFHHHHQEENNRGPKKKQKKMEIQKNLIKQVISIDRSKKGSRKIEPNQKYIKKIKYLVMKIKMGISN